MKMTSAFFDRPAVQRSVDRATRGAISKSLAFVRTRQRSLIRKKKKVSSPGQPPSSHSSDPVASIRNILFAYDARTKSGIVGMVQLNGRRSMVDSGKELPELLEFGGTMRIFEASYDGRYWFSPSPRARRKLTAKHTRRRTAVMRPRPSAGPALKIESDAGNILSPWANVVRG